MTYLGAIGEFVRREIDFAEGAFSNQPPQCIIPYSPKILGGELPMEKHVSATEYLDRKSKEIDYSRSSL
jgi:hypothetical protein